MRDPGAVMARLRLALLVRPHLVHGELVRLRIVPDRDLRRHPAHGMGAAAVTGLDQQVDIGLQERSVHRQGAAIRQHEIRPVPELLDVAEDVVPSPAIEAGDVRAHLVQDLVHLERGKYRLDQHGRLDRALLHAELLLGGDEDVVPQARFQMPLQFRQIKIRAGTGTCQRLVVVGEEDRKIKQRAGYRLAIDVHVLFDQVPAAWAHQQGRGAFIELVGLAARRINVGNIATNRIVEIGLAADDVAPGRRSRVLEIRHEGIHGCVQGIDDHLAIHRPGDLDAPVLKIGRRRRNAPVARANGGGGRQEIRQGASVDLYLAAFAIRK